VKEAITNVAFQTVEGKEVVRTGREKSCLIRSQIKEDLTEKSNLIWKELGYSFVMVNPNFPSGKFFIFNDGGEPVWKKRLQ
jgi:hypothetical protein